MTTVLIVDDQPLQRLGFRMLLEANPDTEVVGEAGHGGEAVRMAAELRPDVILMDVRMPGMDGIEATRRVVAAGDRSRVLILTTFDLDEYAHEALRAGASGFLLKDTAPADMLRAIEVVAAGEALLAPRVTRRLIEEFTRAPAPTFPAAGLRGLTTRELEVLTLVARGLTNAELGACLRVGQTTVKTHIGHLLTKLDARTRAQLVMIAYESGLVERRR